MLTTQIMMEHGIGSAYREPPQAPPVFSRDKSSLIRDAEAVNQKTKILLDEILSAFTPENATFAGVAEAIARNYDHNTTKTRLISFYRKVSPDPEMREYSRKADDIIDEFDNSAVLRRDIFSLVQALYDKRQTLGLDEEQIRLIRRLRQQYVAYGLTIPPGANRERFFQITTQLQSLQAEYRRNLNEENGCLWLTREELLGVPDDVVSNLEKGSGANEGMLQLTFKYPHVNPTVEHATNPETRKRVFVANDNKVPKPLPFASRSCPDKGSLCKMLSSLKRRFV